MEPLDITFLGKPEVLFCWVQAVHCTGIPCIAFILLSYLTSAFENCVLYLLCFSGSSIKFSLITRRIWQWQKRKKWKKIGNTFSLRIYLKPYLIQFHLMFCEQIICRKRLHLLQKPSHEKIWNLISAVMKIKETTSFWFWLSESYVLISKLFDSTANNDFQLRLQLQSIRSHKAQKTSS